MVQEEARTQQDEVDRKRKAVTDFENSQKVVVSNKKPKKDENPLTKTSYWLAESQPELEEHRDSAINLLEQAPPTRPLSPMTQEPLRRKDLIPLELKWNDSNQVICALSSKSIVAQQALALVPKKAEKSAQVVLEQVYNDVAKDKKLCPISGEKIKYILKLHKGGGSFASIGNVEASTYRPTMT